MGKLPNSVLSNMLECTLNPIREDIILRPSVGEDCAAIAFGDTACVVTTDPVTATDINAGEIGITICLNDLRSANAVPVAFLLTILAPLDTSKEEIQIVLEQAAIQAEQYGAEIIGGHTERTDGVNRLILSVTGIGKVARRQMKKTGGCSAGDHLYLIGSLATEANAIIWHEKKDELMQAGWILDGRWSLPLLKKSLRYHVVPDFEGQEVEKSIERMKQAMVLEAIDPNIPVTAMHDVTEGGILGACAEMGWASECRINLYEEQIPVSDLTVALSEKYDVDPLGMIASGSMLVTLPAQVTPPKAWIEIGHVASGKGLYMNDREITPPHTDEIYRVLR